MKKLDTAIKNSMVATLNPLQEKSDNENTLQTDLLSNHDKAEMQATSTTLDDDIHPPFATWKNLIIIGLLYFAMSACGSFSAVSTFIYGELNKNIYAIIDGTTICKNETIYRYMFCHKHDVYF